MRDDGVVQPVGCSLDPGIDMACMRDMKGYLGVVETARGGFNGRPC